jgi:DNA-binding GntR family transcriptional regulator
LETKNAFVDNEARNKRHYQTKQQMAYEIIRGKILDGIYKPQQHLKMIDLTKEIGISSIPIREALKQLEDEGLVKLNLHRGVEVVSYSPEEFEHLYMMRAVLEGLAGRLGTQNITEAGINRMKELLEKMGLASEKGDLEERNQLNFEFHQILYQAANCHQLNRIIVNLWNNSQENMIIRLASKFISDYFECTQKEHVAIVDAVATRLPEVVERLLIESMNNIGKKMADYLRKSDIFNSD